MDQSDYVAVVTNILSEQSYKAASNNFQRVG